MDLLCTLSLFFLLLLFSAEDFCIIIIIITRCQAPQIAMHQTVELKSKFSNMKLVKFTNFTSFSWMSCHFFVYTPVWTWQSLDFLYMGQLDSHFKCNLYSVRVHVVCSVHGCVCVCVCVCVCACVCVCPSMYLSRVDAAWLRVST